MFPDYGFRLTIFGPLAKTFHREMLLITLRSSVITWPAALYMNRELAHVQSGGVDFKLSYVLVR